MTYKKAIAISREPVENKTPEELQKLYIKTLDAWRESKAFYGMAQALKDGFYLMIRCEYADGYTPRNAFLTTNLNYKLDEIEKKLIEIRRRKNAV